MNRRSLFKFLSIGVATAAVAPKMLAEDHCPGMSGTPINKTPFIPKPRCVRHTPEEFGFIQGLMIYEEPREGYDYSIGVETGDGLGGSPSVVSVMRAGKEREPDVQVAEFSSSHHNGAQLVPIVAQISRKYGEKCSDPRGPILVIEQVSAPGDTTQNKLKIMGFTRFFKIAGNVKDRDGKKVKWVREGWYTSKLSYPILMTRFTNAVSEGWYDPKSLQLRQGLDKPEETIRHDRWVRAAAQSYIGLNIGDKRNA